MHPTLADFEIHLAAPAPAFRCYACGDDRKRLRHTARVSHEVGSPASVRELALVKAMLGPDAEQIINFYRKHNGLTLYCDTHPRSYAQGVRFFPINDWPAKSDEMRIQLLPYLEGAPEEKLLKCSAIGEIPHSFNWIVCDTEGSIYYLMHDPMYDSAPQWPSLTDLLENILADPAGFLNDMGCYTRFRDGETETQWIPLEYVDDVDAAVD